MIQDAGEELKPDQELISLSWKKEEKKTKEDHRSYRCVFTIPGSLEPGVGVRPGLCMSHVQRYH